VEDQRTAPNDWPGGLKGRPAQVSGIEPLPPIWRDATEAPSAGLAFIRAKQMLCHLTHLGHNFSISTRNKHETAKQIPFHITRRLHKIRKKYVKIS
jgi:hypothetical protein